MTVQEFMREAEPHGRICDAIAKTWDVLGRHQRPVVSVSGGSDSDIVVDIIHKLDEDHKAVYVWFNTGLEFAATRKHLDYLESRYGIEILRERALRPIPESVKLYGYPFFSKFVSERLYSLQIRGFDFSTERSFDEDMSRYEKCYSTLKWWHNIGSYKLFNIGRDRGLKEYIMRHPLPFLASSRCCDYSKKLPAKRFMRALGGDLEIIGVRKAEGGIRLATQNCYTHSPRDNWAVFRPLFWMTDKDKAAYVERFGIVHSDCYTVYGMKRTGCVGCPYNSRAERELELVGAYEPALVKAAYAVFGQVYEYTRGYKEFRASLPMSPPPCRAEPVSP